VRPRPPPLPPSTPLPCAMPDASATAMRAPTQPIPGGRVLPRQQPPPAPAFPSDGRPPGDYLAAALRCADFLRREMYDEGAGELRRSYCDGASTIAGA